MGFDELGRELYTRQIMMKEIGEAGQEKLANASVLVVGCGGLGSPVLYYLTAMGIGHLGLVDGDIISVSNLNRQLLYTTEDIGSLKVVTAKKRLLALNPKLKITVYDSFLDHELASSILPTYDIAVDCLDNFCDRFVLNDACIIADMPYVHAGVGEFSGQLLTITPGKGPCLRCLFPEGGQKKEPGKPTGIIGSTAGVIGALQALEVLKYFLGLPINNDGFVIFNGLSMSLEKTPLSASPYCSCQNRGLNTEDRSL